MKKRIKGRKPILRSLPPLAKICADFRGFKGDENRAEHVFTILTQVIQRCRRATPQPFYAMRDVSKFFGVSLTTMSRIYGRLNREGMLTLVRSSRSIIPARVPRPRFAVRGVVCMPIWLPGFLQFLDWRRGFSQLEEELFRYHFVLEPIFYRLNEELAPEFVDRVLKFNPNYLLWNHPCCNDDMTMRSIADTGVSLLVIQTSGELFPFVGRVYRQSYERGLRQGLKEWKASGEIDQIIIPKMADIEISVTQVLDSALKSCGLPHQFKASPSPPSRGDWSSLKDFIRRLAPNPRAGIIFDDDLFYSRLCLSMPAAMLKLFCSHRVMVMREVILPSLTPPPEGVTVDALLLSGKQLARRIARDLNRAQGNLTSDEIIFEAEWRPQIPLSSVMQTLFYE